MFGFAKSEQENIGSDELVFLRALAKNWLTADNAKIRKEIVTGNLQEIEDDEET
jgi:hypothetical protein